MVQDSIKRLDHMTSVMPPHVTPENSEKFKGSPKRGGKISEGSEKLTGSGKRGQKRIQNSGGRRNSGGSPLEDSRGSNSEVSGSLGKFSRRSEIFQNSENPNKFPKDEISCEIVKETKALGAAAGLSVIVQTDSGK
jgi:hypothetical protein